MGSFRNGRHKHIPTSQLLWNLGKFTTLVKDFN